MGKYGEYLTKSPHRTDQDHEDVLLALGVTSDELLQMRPFTPY